jgi:hypothetical protein
MKSLRFIAGLALILCGAASCQKVITIKPNAFTQRYVIEGELTDAPGPHSVKVTRTRSVTDDNSFDAVNDAQVIITDQTNGVVDTLQLNAGGEYRTTRVTGIAGHTYQLSVRIGSEVFTGASTIPAVAVNIDSMYVDKSQFGDDYFIVPVFTDPAGRGNYYRLKQWLNGRLLKGSWLRDDNARDGQTYKSPLRYQSDEDNAGSDPKISSGDSIRVELQSISKQSYDYYRTLEDVTGYSFTTPANPLTNLTGGALGVFATGLSRTKGIVAKF